jgi:hypothetical protein
LYPKRGVDDEKNLGHLLIKKKMRRTNAFVSELNGIVVGRPADLNG